MDCRVVVEAAVPVYDVESSDEAVRIAISKTGEMLNPDLNYVEIDMAGRSCPHCGDDLEPAFVAADESLVALELEMTVFNVEREEHASRIARKEIGQRLENIPLGVELVEVVEDEETGSTDSMDETGPTDSTDETAEDDLIEEPATSPSDKEQSGSEDTGDELPDFDDIVDG